MKLSGPIPGRVAVGVIVWVGSEVAVGVGGSSVWRTANSTGGWDAVVRRSEGRVVLRLQPDKITANTSQIQLFLYLSN